MWTEKEINILYIIENRKQKIKKDIFSDRNIDENRIEIIKNEIVELEKVIDGTC